MEKEVREGYEANKEKKVITEREVLEEKLDPKDVEDFRENVESVVLKEIMDLEDTEELKESKDV